MNILFNISTSSLNRQIDNVYLSQPYRTNETKTLINRILNFYNNCNKNSLLFKALNTNVKQTHKIMESKINLTANEIFENHFKAFQNKDFNIFTESPKFKTANEVRQFLINGSILPALWNKTSENSLSIANQMGLNALLDFSSEKQKSQFRKVFINALKQLNIN